ncbi:hypothetical protein T8K17_12750 [Thalassobaculum sp. OXR-137]|uniref:hypothetical protein n=1 Tax=Thalassobaculum sp. OXR-137 TaxID=3100173 RepID=UPI002AC89D2F|nr:hypothetical protein [Thalassobaculum sp. OXR-137]WPZ36995.1 hypothetical protein T8K17_12750 [Thalassobaculum sp. OXR-137]
MAAKPNYNFERRERERLKAEKKAKRLADKKRAVEGEPEGASEDSNDQAETPSTDEQSST